jgi:glucose dehydrogenase
VATGDLHIAVTNPAPDLPIHIRQGDNLYTNSIVVLDVRTGKLRWHRQLIKNDSHDWDLTHASPLVTTTLGGAVRRLVTTVGKDGMLRAIDRDSKNIVYEAAVTTRENAEIPDVLYRFNTGGPMGGGIATYATGGRQYVAAASGSPSSFWVDQNPGSPTIFVFALPR